MFLCEVITFIVPSGDIFLSVASWYMLLAVLMIAEAKWQKASSISEVFGSRSFGNNVQVSLVKSSQ